MKKRIIKDFNNLPEVIREDIRKTYPHGYFNHLISFFDKEKHLISALPFETEDVSYLVKMPSAIHLDEEDDTNDEDVEGIPNQDPFGELDEEKYLIQEEEEEESD